MAFQYMSLIRLGQHLTNISIERPTFCTGARFRNLEGLISEIPKNGIHFDGNLRKPITEICYHETVNGIRQCQESFQMVYPLIAMFASNGITPETWIELMQPVGVATPMLNCHGIIVGEDQPNLKNKELNVTSCSHVKCDREAPIKKAALSAFMQGILGPAGFSLQDGTQSNDLLYCIKEYGWDALFNKNPTIPYANILTNMNMWIQSIYPIIKEKYLWSPGSLIEWSQPRLDIQVYGQYPTSPIQPSSNQVCPPTPRKMVSSMMTQRRFSPGYQPRALFTDKASTSGQSGWTTTSQVAPEYPKHNTSVMFEFTQGSIRDATTVNSTVKLWNNIPMMELKRKTAIGKDLWFNFSIDKNLNKLIESATGYFPQHATQNQLEEFRNTLLMCFQEIELVLQQKQLQQLD